MKWIIVLTIALGLCACQKGSGESTVFEYQNPISEGIDGPWTKHPDNPFYGAQSKTACEERGFTFTGDPESPFNQVGHNEIFIGPDGRFWLSCHGIQPDKPPMLVIDPIWFDETGNIQSDGPTYTKQIIKIQ